MVMYSVMLKRFKGSTRPDVCLCREEDREVAIRQMRKYVRENEFSIHDRDGWFTIAGVVLVEQEPIVGAPVLSVTPYHDIFDIYDNRK